MPSNYCLRLYKYDPSQTSGLANGSPQLRDVYGPMRALAGWAASFAYGNSDFSEQLVSMSDPNGQNQISNVNAIDFRCGLPTEGDRDVVVVGLVAAGSQGAQKGGDPAQAVPSSVIALPGGRKRMPASGRLTIAAGALTFQL